jgi:hypothetical protein
LRERNLLAEKFLCELIEQADEDVDWSKSITRQKAVNAAFALAELFLKKAELEVPHAG